MATIQGIYIALFGRPADPTGLAYFNGVTKDGADLSAIGDLSTQKEYTDRFTGLNSTQIINSIYQSLFGRDADSVGLAFFSNALATGAQTINTIAINILDGAQGADLTTINAKIAAANIFTAHLDLPSEIAEYNGATAITVGQAFINGVDGTHPGTAAAADAAILTLAPDQGQQPGGGAPGGGVPSGPDAPVFFATLVSGNVTFSGTATGDITEGADGAFSRGGTAAGQFIDNVKNTTLVLSSDDHLILTASQADHQGVSGTGSVEINGLGAAAVDLSEITAGGVAHVSASATLAAGTVLAPSVAVDVQALQTLGLTAAQANNVTIQGAGNTNVAASAGAQTINVLSTGTNVIHTGTGGDTVIGGAGADTIYADDVRTVTAGSRETITIDLGGHSGLSSYTIGGAGLSSPITITTNNGSGGSDTAEASFLTAFNANATLSASYTATSFSQGGTNHIRLTATADGNPSTDLTVTPVAHDTDAFQITSDSNTGSVTLTLNSTSFTGGGSLVLPAISMTSSDSTMADRVAQSINDNYGSTIKATSNSDTVSVTWQASGAKGDLTISDNRGSDFIAAASSHSNNGTGGNASVTTTQSGASGSVSVTADIDVLKGGAGHDTFVINASTVGATDRILDFNANEDKISFVGGSGSFTFTDKTATSAGASLTTAVVNSVLGSTATNSVALFNTADGHSYVLLHGDSDATFTNGVDQVVDVTGHTGTFSAGDFSWA